MINKYEEWNKKQEELFELFFQEKTEETVNLKDIVDSSKQIHEIWYGLYKILKTLNTFDDYSRIEKIKKINYKNKNYLILKQNIWEYIIIDLETNQTLSCENAIKIFSEDFFVQNFKEEIGYKPSTFYDFYECSLETTQLIINYFNKYESILSNNKRIEYVITNENLQRVFISLELSKLQIILGFQVFGENSNVNYVFINKNLKPTGSSNPTRNEKSLVKMGIRVCEIEVPKKLIPEYLLKFIEENIISDKRIKLSVDDNIK